MGCIERRTGGARVVEERRLSEEERRIVARLTVDIELLLILGWKEVLEDASLGMMETVTGIDNDLAAFHLT